MCRLNRCCCYSLRQGCLIFGLDIILLEIIILVYEYFYGLFSVMTIWMIIHVVLAVVCIILALVFILTILKDRRNLALILAVIIVVLVIVETLMCLNGWIALYGLIPSVLCVLLEAGVLCFALLVVYSYAREDTSD
ncbi:uncharacterized protein LOC115632576 [Scaptodrosophila lebanonensis]|uniref:Uncharacterized protein LOC115632576 n=1 Tax=Drosophila lebanonensis TaxID=7225 RepID=A0A6J2UE06_DROLE|nr:uncharacterized protein LOC115632576 [Scaptodrosophila lebanonensis]